MSTSLFRYLSIVGVISLTRSLSLPVASKVALNIVECRFRVAAESSDSSPSLASSRIFISVLSSCCRNTCSKRTDQLITLPQHSVSKAKQPLLNSTGGSWKKSPHTTSCTPPNGRQFPRPLNATKLRFSQKEPAIMLIPSMTRMSTSLHLALASLFITTRLASSMRGPLPTPIPENLWIVEPRRCTQPRLWSRWSQWCGACHPCCRPACWL